MKKLYSIVLMAAALLIGTNAWANDVFNGLDDAEESNTVKVTIGSTTKYAADLQTAVNAVAAGETATIQLLQPQLLEAPVIIPQLPSTAVEESEQVANRERQIINLDLNGKNIGPKTGYMGPAFMLFKGELNVTGSGSILRSGNPTSAPSNIDASAIVIFGADGDKRSGYTDRSKQEWSTLTIGKDVNVKAEGQWTKKGKNYGAYGICIQNFGSSANKVNVYGINPANFGYYTYYPNGTGNAKMWWNGNSGSAFGVKIIISGIVEGTQRGINVLGTINQAPEDVEGAKKRITDAYPYYQHYYPYVKVEADAVVRCSDGSDYQLESGNGGIYGGGWCIYDISGDVYGQTGVYLKAGDAVVEDNGHVYSTSDLNQTNANYGGNVAGNGIFIASASNYAGGTNVSIEDNAKIEGNGGAAIVDALASNTTETTVENIEIKGGTIVGGDAGAIIVTPETAGNGHTTVYDVNLEGNTNVETGTTNGLLDLLVQDEHGDANAYVTTTVDENGKTVLVVTSGAGSAPGVVANDFDIDNFTLGDVNLSDAGLTNKNQIFDSADKTRLEIGTLMMNNTTDKVTLTIAAGHTIVAQKVIMSAKAQIIVEPGATLIVTGHSGVNTLSASNIILKNEAGERSIFLFHPDVEANRHPMATVELLTNSWYEDASNYQWENFGLPTHNAVQSITCTETAAGVVYAEVQVYEHSAWNSLGYIGGTYTIPVAQLNKPFVACNLIAYRARTEEAPKVKVEGELVGNINASLESYMKWTPFANSYTAEINGATLLHMLETEAQNIDPYFYVAKSAGLGSLTWEPIDEDEPENIKPMQAFLFNNQGTTTEVNTVNYENMVWTPATSAPAPAPRRMAANNNSAKMRVIVANKQGAWDIVKFRENGLNRVCEKYMNEDVNIYAMADEKAAILATENLENTYVGFSTVKGGNFTISFANVEGREFTLVDHETGARVAMVEGNTYEFTAAANSVNDYRFEIVESAKLPTAIENTEAVKSAKGVYTITGQYVGEMNVWNTLPAGIYVVNGEKRVK